MMLENIDTEEMMRLDKVNDTNNEVEKDLTDGKFDDAKNEA